MSGLTIVATVIDISSTVANHGKAFAAAIIKDETGKVSLKLWRNQVDQVKVGDIIKLTDAFVQGFSTRSLNVATRANIFVISK